MCVMQQHTLRACYPAVQCSSSTRSASQMLREAKDVKTIDLLTLLTSHVGRPGTGWRAPCIDVQRQWEHEGT